MQLRLRSALLRLLTPRVRLGDTQDRRGADPGARPRGGGDAGEAVWALMLAYVDRAPQADAAYAGDRRAAARQRRP
jgi:hypothetical protein